MLTPRDLDAIEFLLEHKAAPLDVVGRLFFLHNPQTGRANKDCAKACERRMYELTKQGYVSVESVREKGNNSRTRVASPTAKAAALFSKPKPKPVHGRSRDHHYASLRAVVALQERLSGRGYSIEDVKLEHALRAKAQAGSAQGPGDSFASFPDAALIAVSENGARFAVAVEYVTSKYSDVDIVSKATSFNENYKRVQWVADTKATAARITRLTGQPASTAQRSLA